VTTERTYRALLVGTGTYAGDRDLDTLYGPRNDVDRMAVALSDPEWGLHDPANVVKMVDASKADIEAAMEEFFSDAHRDDQLLFFYSGHGIQDLNGNLFLGAADTRSSRPYSSAVAVALLNSLTGSTRAAATAIVLDCCYSGAMKGPGLTHALDSRGRWTLTSSRRDQLSADARNPDGLSAFTRHVCGALVANHAVDADGDGYVTMADVNRYVGPRLAQETGQDAMFKSDGSGELVIALAPGYAVEFDQARTSWTLSTSGARVTLPEIPRSSSAVEAPVVDEREAEALPGNGVLSAVGVDAEAVVAVVLDALENGRDITVRRVLQETTRDAVRLVERDQSWTELGDALNRLTCLGAAFLNHRVDGWFREALVALVRVYESGFDSHGMAKPDGQIAGGVTPAELWIAIHQRILALGALAVRIEQWEAVRLLAMQRPNGQDFRHYNNWLRHAVTTAARSNLLRVEVDGQFQDRSVVRDAVDFIRNHSCVRPDVSAESEEKLLASVCQFDALGCVAAISAAGSLDGSNFYPNFARFYSTRTEPAFHRLVTDERLRAQIAPIPDDDLSIVLNGLDRAARSEGVRFNGWSGFDDPAVIEWFARVEGRAT
jgi:hypothetical protein